jgi:hypothetical protein
MPAALAQRRALCDTGSHWSQAMPCFGCNSWVDVDNGDGCCWRLLPETAASWWVFFCRACRRRLRFEVVRSITGERVQLPHLSNRLSNRFYENTTVEWVLEQVGQHLHWPTSHLTLGAGETTVRYIHRISEIPNTKIIDLAMASGYTVDLTATQAHDARPFTLQLTKLPPPDNFSGRGLCLCNFGGCCRACNAPNNTPCWGCGNNGCCRTGDCGELCCLGVIQRSSRRPFVCPLVGCVPCWIDDGPPEG